LASSRTQPAFEPSIMCTCSGGFGSSVSMALAKGCTRSGHCGSKSQSAVPQCRQKRRSAELFCPSIRAWNMAMFSSPSTFRVAALAPRLTA